MSKIQTKKILKIWESLSFFRVIISRHSCSLWPSRNNVVNIKRVRLGTMLYQNKSSQIKIRDCHSHLLFQDTLESGGLWVLHTGLMSHLSLLTQKRHSREIWPFSYKPWIYSLLAGKHSEKGEQHTRIQSHFSISSCKLWIGRHFLWVKYNLKVFGFTHNHCCFISL